MGFLDKSSKHAFLSAICWLLIGTVVGLWESLLLAFPAINDKLPDLLLRFVEYGKLRQVHVNILAFAWVSLAFIGALFYIIPRLAQKPLFSEKLGVIAVHVWNAAILAGVLGMLFGYTRAREYAELFWPTDALWLISFILINITVWKTMLRRKQKRLAVPAWYLLGSIIWMPLIIILGKGLWSNFFTNPFVGVFDNVANWFLGHNILGLWFTTLGVGVAYFVVPRVSKTRIYSHYLSLIGFWTLVLFYPAVGAHHTLAGPIPSWLMSEATVFSILMAIPVITAVFNIFKSSKPRIQDTFDRWPLKFILVGMAFYAFVSVQGSFQALRWVSEYLHFSQWVPAHAMLAIGGGFSLIAFGGFYYCYPRIVGRHMKSARLISWHFWLTTFGISAIFLGLTTAGLIQGADWSNTTAGMHWIDATVRAVRPEIIFLALGGVTYIAGQVVFTVNLVKTGFRKSGEEIVHIDTLDNHPEYVLDPANLPSV